MIVIVKCDFSTVTFYQNNLPLNKINGKVYQSSYGIGIRYTQMYNIFLS